VSTLLFAVPSYLSGAARVFDFMGFFDAYNVSPTPKEADARATLADWRAVGEDICWAMSREPAPAAELIEQETP
jgi:hypothetical protein